MADWLGHLMVGWPTWLIGAVVIVIAIVAIAIIWWTEAAGFGNTTIYNSRRKRSGKK